MRYYFAKSRTLTFKLPSQLSILLSPDCSWRSKKRIRICLKFKLVVILAQRSAGQCWNWIEANHRFSGFIKSRQRLSVWLVGGSPTLPRRSHCVRKLKVCLIELNEMEATDRCWWKKIAVWTALVNGWKIRTKMKEGKKKRRRRIGRGKKEDRNERENEATKERRKEKRKKKLN